MHRASLPFDRDGGTAVGTSVQRAWTGSALPIAAVRSGSHGPLEVLAERWIVPSDPSDRIANATTHRGPSALDRRGSSPRSSGQTDRSRQLERDELDLFT